MTDPSAFPDIHSGRMIRTADLLRNGVTTRGINDAMRRGLLTRIYRGWYVSSATWNSFSPDIRYRTFVMAVGRSARSPLVFSHHSAAVLHGLPIVSPWPDCAHVLTPGAPGGSSKAFVRTHAGPPDGSLVTIGGTLATSMRRTVIDLAAATDFADGVSVVDAALRLSETAGRGHAAEERERLLHELHVVSPTRGVARAQRAIAFGDPRSESVGESLSRARMAELGFEAPELQAEFATRGANYAVDFYWPSANLIGEFDGRVKYSRSDLMAGRPAEEVVWREKRREDSIRGSSQARFLRWTWSTAISRVDFGQFLSSNGVPRSRPDRAHRKSAVGRYAAGWSSARRRNDEWR